MEHLEYLDNQNKKSLQNNQLHLDPKKNKVVNGELNYSS